MRQYKHVITSFKELMDEVFYDWGMTRDLQQINVSDGGYWINKTLIFQEPDNNQTNYLVWFLSYKTETSKIDNTVMTHFETFFEFYNKDKEFWNLLNYIENNWYKNDFIITSNTISLGKLEFVKDIDLKYYIKFQETKVEIKKTSYQKLTKFVELLTTTT